MIAFTWDFKTVLVIAVVIGLAIVLAYRLLNRDDRVWRTRYGFFVERDRYDENELDERPDEAMWPKHDDP